MKKLIAIGLFAAVFTVAFSLPKKVRLTVPKGWPKPANDQSRKPLSPNKVLLGRALFYDPVLSRDSTISCSSCHTQYAAFTHVDHALSHGIDGRVGVRNSPSLMNLAWNTSFMWDGRVASIYNQAELPIKHPDEMAETVEGVAAKLNRQRLYRSLFYQSFGDSVATGGRLQEAIGAFMLTLVSSNAKYDSVMRKQSEFTAQEQNGYLLFQRHCNGCHTEPLFTNLGFENNGLPVDAQLADIGRMKITGDPADSLKFKTPTLRNIEYSFPYMHDGRFKKLYDVLGHYTGGIAQSPTLSPLLRRPIALTANEKIDLIAFLVTLSDRHFIHKSDYGYPKNIFQP